MKILEVKDVVKIFKTRGGDVRALNGVSLDVEEQFDKKVLEVIKESEHVSEAVAEAMKHRDLVAHMTDDEVEDYVHDGWNEVWRDYI